MSVALQELLVILFQLLIATTEGSLMQDVSGDHLDGCAAASTFTKNMGSEQADPTEKK